MKIRLYDVTIVECVAMLETLQHLLDKAEAYATERSFDFANLMHDRLAPDMYDFVVQIRIACRNACDFAAQASGRPMPTLEKKQDETIMELRLRIETALTLLRSIQPAEIDGAEDKKMTLYFMPGKYMLGHEFVTQYLQPNFYFHVVIAYAILRARGVPLGKADYTMHMSVKDEE
ncbi:MAG: hypothetical protein A3C84_00235 [Candidatus Ryanbacteria bacterium RIFCSPHIGHO2_02_FULL_48_12]|uniref:DUF1993 domain-containing protein n=1 Tax=Candidatus Ryanbacteria bacterium RIFCSPHIGHO2_01_FULL_48_27 TaxID=1802115 RepID=A0A1G2G5F7_9BACT|nr:MAG: hypothetical protein A2756_00205 [Candidatus Ryanbacteria bacterium RIFCSPHIGHO2_01_FULL_48_27]OGZ50404.1 MAG: hypothetical protein A3C84_00235 [Candidatus Ryanbacteria bacterium RIFCSPHIGHO2_02_FULL_48_12]